jgi:hypothetical protein
MTNPDSEQPPPQGDDDTPTYGFPPVQAMPRQPIRKLSRTYVALIIAVGAVAVLCGTVFAALTSGSHQPSQPAGAQATSPSPTSADRLGTAQAATAAPTSSGATTITTAPTTARATTASPVSPQPTTATPQPPPPPPNLCGAPPNPYGYNFCGGSVINRPPSDICSYLNCVTKFPDGNGFIIECKDSTFSTTGGTKSVCAKHNGYLQTLYQ